MDHINLFFVSLLSLISLYLLCKLSTPKGKNLPPSPPSLPIIGHLHLIKRPLYKVLQHLSSKYGPIMALRFGSRPVLVLTSPSAVEECFTKHDTVSANRPFLLGGKYLDYDHMGVGSLPYGRLWRDVRRLMTLEIFSAARLKADKSVREDEVRFLIKELFQDSFQDFKRIELKSRLHELSFNIILNTIAGKRSRTEHTSHNSTSGPEKAGFNPRTNENSMYGTKVDDSKEVIDFKDVISEGFDAIGATYPGDFIPFLKWINFQGMEKKFQTLQKKSDSFMQKMIDAYRSKILDSSMEGRKPKTFIEAILSLQESEPDYYTDNVIKGNILALLFAGTDTSFVTIEWAMSLLLNHPTILEKARAEVDEYIGQERLVQEDDLPNLPYIECIVNETLRLFPAAPLLLPHELSEDCTIGGFDVARGTIVLVNALAIHKDPTVWDDPLSFTPERFKNVRNDGYRFMPFGKGRRKCPGSGLANKIVGLTLASLIQCFEWKRVGEELVDMSEGKGVTIPKDEPLVAMCKARNQMSFILME